MKYLKKIFENRENIDELYLIEEEIEVINDIFFDIKDLGFRINIEYGVSDYNEFDGSFSYLKDIEIGDLVVLTGYIINLDLRTEQFNIKHIMNTDDLNKYVEFMDIFTKSLMTIDSHLNLKSYFMIEDNVIFSVKKETSLQDYYYIFNDLLRGYVDEYFSNYKIYKEGNNYYLEFVLKKAGESTIGDFFKTLKSFYTDWEKINYDSIEKANNNSFRIKNPKIKTINI
jgi:hypothetical protein